MLAGLTLAAVVSGCGLYVSELTLRDNFARSLYQEIRRRPPHPLLQVVASHQVRTNRSGFRGDPIKETKPAGTFRIFALGGSTTLGVANRDDETYPYQLQTLLRERYPNVPIDVQNAGVAWHSTAHMLVNYELRVRQFDPDLVVVFEAINDLYRGFSPPWFASGPFASDYGHYLGPYARWMGPDTDSVTGMQPPLYGQWLLWRALRRRVGDEPTPFDFRQPNAARVAARLKSVDVTDFRALPTFRRNYERLVRNVLSDDHKVVVASQPFLYADNLSARDRALLYFPQIFCAENGQYPSLDSMIAGMTQFNAEARRVAERTSVPFIDFDGAVPKNGAYFTDDVHLTAAANRILARMVFDWIVDARLIDDRRPAR